MANDPAVNQALPLADASPEEAIARGAYKDALARCARAHGQAIGRLCMALTGSQAEADELVQEILLLAYDAFPSYRGEGSIRAWLLGIARRVCARHVETRERQARLRLVHSSAERPLTSTTEEVAIAREAAERARRALGALKPSERDAVLLRYEGGLAFREVALACGVDEATARKRVNRAIARLREVIFEEEKRTGER